MHNVLRMIGTALRLLIAGAAFVCWLLTAITYGRI